MVLPALQGKGHVRQRSLSADLMLFVVVCFIGTHYLASLGLVTLYQDKVTATAAIERSAIYLFALLLGDCFVPYSNDAREDN